MYKSIYYDKRESMLHLWDDEIGYVCQKFRNYAFVRSEFGKYQSMAGERVDKIYDFEYGNSDAYEVDFPVETKALIEIYGDTDEPAKNVKMLIIDIETDSTGGFPSMTSFDKEITAFAYYDKSTDQYKCLILDKEDQVSEYKKDNIEVLSYNCEESLLQAILSTFETISPDVVTGWNTSLNHQNQGFDIPYLYGRMCNILGESDANRLSEIGQCYVKKRDNSVVIAGLNCIDYMFLYKKFTFEPRPTLALDYIGKLEVGKGKIKYEGSLNTLYKSDINKFIEYNLCDVQIVKMLDDKFKFVDLAFSVCAAGHVPAEWFHMSSRFIEGAIVNYMRKNGNMVAPNGIMASKSNPSDGSDPAIFSDRTESFSLKHNSMEYVDYMGDAEDLEDEDGEVDYHDGENEKFEGAYVKAPVPGLYNWVFSADINSLYPSAIRTLNISPETWVGKVENWNVDDFVKGNLKEVKIGGEVYTFEDFKKFIKDATINISSIGALYKGDKPGVVPSILSLWFKQRKEFQALSKQYGKEGDKEKEAYYNRRQHVQKIFLNSVYGNLGRMGGRFYSKDNAESTTITGQTIIKTSEKIVIDYFKEKYKQYGKEIGNTDNIVVYIDTDSLYVPVASLADLEGIPELDRKEYTKKCCREVSDKINSIYPILSKRMFNSDNNQIKIAADTINKTALWKKKKAYALYKVYDMDKDKDVDKIEVKGLASVRSDFPPKFKVFLEKFLKDVLYKVDKREIDSALINLIQNMESYEILDVAKNTSVRFYSEQKKTNYNASDRTAFRAKKGATAQCVAGLMYNDLLKIFNLNKKVEPIFDGQKIKYIYLKKNPYGIKAMAFKNDGTDPLEIMHIIDEYCDKKKMYTKLLKNKITDFYEILSWKMPVVGEENIRKFFDF